MWHTRKSRWVIDLVVGLGTAIAEDLQVTNGHPCALGEDAAHLREDVGVGPTQKTMVLICGTWQRLAAFAQVTAMAGWDC
jgi:hypothetical protein